MVESLSVVVVVDLEEGALVAFKGFKGFLKLKAFTILYCEIDFFFPEFKYKTVIGISRWRMKYYIISI